MGLKRISVIMPAFNAEYSIGKSIESVLRQSYSDIELIIVNDGSSDRTREIVLDYMKKDNRIKYYEQQNQGVSVARNNGMGKATGEYISFLDADDLWKESMLEKMYSKILSKKAEFVYGRTEEIFSNGKTEMVGPQDNIEGFLEDFIHKTNELRLRFHISAMLIKKQLIIENELQFIPGIKISEDTGFMIELLCLTKAYFVPEVVSYYIRREKSATTDPWEPLAWKGQIVIYEMIESFIKKYRNQALIPFYKMRNYVAYRFVLTCIRNGYMLSAKEAIEDWQKYLCSFLNDGGKLNDRIKCRLMLIVYPSEKWLRIISDL